MDTKSDRPSFNEVYFPHAVREQARVRENGIHFVHYTRAEVAMDILRSRHVWMRKTSCMNDFTEVRHGLQRLANAYRGANGERLKGVLEGLYPGISGEIEDRFNSWDYALEYDTYIMCVSEHRDDEDLTGRLSMWRAYGVGAGVALVLNNTPFLSPSDALKAYSSPVAYLDDQAFDERFGEFVHSLEKHSDYLKSEGKEVTIWGILSAFKFAALCTKHPGFREELEWRVLYTPAHHRSDHLIKEIQAVGGIPQPIYKIPLRNIPEEGFHGAEIPELVDRIIIGPTAYAMATYEAFKELLTDAGVADAGSRIVVSDIPLR